MHKHPPSSPTCQKSRGTQLFVTKTFSCDNAILHRIVCLTHWRRERELLHLKKPAVVSFTTSFEKIQIHPRVQFFFVTDLKLYSETHGHQQAETSGQFFG